MHSFRAGILSPAAQDQVDTEAWLQGAARLDNLVVERDGGVTGRPAFVRSDVTPPQPRYGLIAGTWRVDAGTDAGPTPRRGSGVRGGTFPTGYYAEGGDGIARFPEDLRMESYRADTSKDLLRVDLLPGRPRAITFHGVVIRQGTWKGQDAGFDRLNLRLVGRNRAQPVGTTVRFDGAPGVSLPEQPLAFGKFAPGVVARDLTVRLIPDGAQAPVSLAWVAIRYARAGAASATRAFELSVQGVSCFSDTGSGNAVELPPSVLNRPFRIIPWVIRNQTFVLVLGMDWVSVLVVGEDGSIERRLGDDANSRGVWHFSARQLRELTWAAFGGNLLLFHQDFPMPLEVHLPIGGRTFGISPLNLRNMPELSQAAQGRIAPEITSAGDVFQVAQGITRVPQVVSYTAVGAPRSIRVNWSPTGADAYKIYWTTETNFNAETRGGIAWNAQASTTASSRTVSSTLTTFDIPNLVSGTRYAVAVVSLIEGNESAVGTPRLVTALFDEFTAPVVTIRNHATIDARVDLSWPAIARADRYVVQWRAGTQLYNTSRQRIATTNSYAGIFVAGAQYAFRVRARSSTGVADDGPWSAEVSIRVLNTAPGAPTNFAAATSMVFPSAVSLTWTAGARADGVDIQQRVQGQTAVTDSTATESPADIIELTAGTTYEFRIRSTRTNGLPSGWTAWMAAVASATSVRPRLTAPDWRSWQVSTELGRRPPRNGFYSFYFRDRSDDATGFRIQWRLTRGATVVRSGEFAFLKSAADTDRLPARHAIYHTPSALFTEPRGADEYVIARIRATAPGYPASFWSAWSTNIANQ